MNLENDTCAPRQPETVEETPNLKAEARTFFLALPQQSMRLEESESLLGIYRLHSHQKIRVGLDNLHSCFEVKNALMAGRDISTTGKEEGTYFS